MEELPLDFPIMDQTTTDKRPKFDRLEAVKGRPIKPATPRLVFEIEETTATTNIPEAKALMKMLLLKFKTQVKEFGPEELQFIELDIPLELFEHLLKWIQIHAREGRGVGTRQLRKLDMKNLATYTKIYLQGEGIVEKNVLKNIGEYVKGLVIRATVPQLSDFAELANRPHSKSDDKKFEVLKEALVMKFV
jgi:hypothetical protein